MITNPSPGSCRASPFEEREKYQILTPLLFGTSPFDKRVND
ncbi:MAG: hypothetical protein AAB574_00025 [Patescibacteria group bacterium]